MVLLSLKDAWLVLNQPDGNLSFVALGSWKNIYANWFENQFEHHASTNKYTFTCAKAVRQLNISHKVAWTNLKASDFTIPRQEPIETLRAVNHVVMAKWDKMFDDENARCVFRLTNRRFVQIFRQNKSHFSLAFLLFRRFVFSKFVQILLLTNVPFIHISCFYNTQTRCWIERQVSKANETCCKYAAILKRPIEQVNLGKSLNFSKRTLKVCLQIDGWIQGRKLITPEKDIKPLFFCDHLKISLNECHLNHFH